MQLSQKEQAHYIHSDLVTFIDNLMTYGFVKLHCRRISAYLFLDEGFQQKFLIFMLGEKA